MGVSTTFEAVGVPAAGSMDTGASEPLGQPGMKHWKQAAISNPDLADRGGIFFAAVEMTRMPMVLSDPNADDCPIVFANNAFLDLTGYELSEILGRNCRFLQGANTDAATVTKLREAVAAHRPEAVEILNYRRNGTPFWNAVFLAPVFGKDGELVYFFASQLDVSNRREAESALRQSQKMEAIGQLTAGLAHDFNNMLQVITASLERISVSRDDDVAFDRHHATASAAADRGAKLTKQLLAFARRTRLEPKPVDLSALVASFGDLLESSVGDRAKLHFSTQRRLPAVKVDPIHLEMALLNIVANARDASPPGSPITITTRTVCLDGDAAAKQLDPGEYVTLSVADEGCGMEPHIRARAMEPFFTTKRPGEGTGLGLAMVHGFVQQSGGQLELQSRPGQGTTVTMYFATARPEADFVPSGFRPEVVAQRAQAGPLILVVDDVRELAELAGEMLTDIGYRVAIAHSAEEALTMFDQALQSADPVKLLFSDVLMPGGMNGLMLAQAVRLRAPDMPILLTTGYNDEMALDSPQAGLMDVLGKPYRRSELISRVQAAMRRHVSPRSGRMTSDFGHAQG